MYVCVLTPPQCTVACWNTSLFLGLSPLCIAQAAAKHPDVSSATQTGSSTCGGRQEVHVLRETGTDAPPCFCLRLPRTGRDVGGVRRGVLRRECRQHHTRVGCYQQNTARQKRAPGETDSKKCYCLDMPRRHLGTALQRLLTALPTRLGSLAVLCCLARKLLGPWQALRAAQRC